MRSSRTKLYGAVILSLVFSLVSLTAVAQDGNNVVLKYWHTHGPRTDEAKALKDIVSQFEEEHPNIDIKTQQIPYDEMHRQLIVSLSAGTAPDLARIDIVWVPEFAHMGGLVPLNKKLGEEFKSYPDRFFEGPLSTTYWKGDYYGLPVSTNTRILYWNKKMFEDSGVEGPPETWKEFTETARALTKDTNNDGETDQWGVALGGTYPWATLPLFWNAGGKVTNDEVNKATGYLNSDESVKALKSIVKLYEDGALAPTITGGGIGTYEGYAKNKYAMMLSGPWGASILGGQFPDKEIHRALVPKGPESSNSVIGGEDIVIFKQSAHPEAAWEFVKFMERKESRLRMAKAGIIPVLKGLADHEYIKKHPTFSVFLKQMKNAKARPVHYNWPKIKDTLTGAFERAIRGIKSPEKALDDAAKNLDKLLK